MVFSFIYVRQGRRRFPKRRLMVPGQVNFFSVQINGQRHIRRRRAHGHAALFVPIEHIGT